MDTLAILGMGLMGGSLGLAARQRGAAARVQAYARREETRQAALAMGAADAVFESAAGAVAGADMVVLCVPVLRIPELLALCVGSLPENCIVTDVGSTKVELGAACETLLAGSGAAFVGSHPVAGSERTGIEAADAALYEGAVTVVTAEPGGDDEAVRRTRALWTAVGSEVVCMSPEAHDRLIARTSHLPHLVASTLVAAVLDEGDEAARLCGSGFRDTTRVAGGSEEMWHDIVKSNRDSVQAELDRFAQKLDGVREWIRNEEYDALRAFLAHTRETRRRLHEPGYRD